MKEVEEVKEKSKRGGFVALERKSPPSKDEDGAPVRKDKGFTTEDTENPEGAESWGGSKGSNGDKGGRGTESRGIHRKRRDGKHYLAAKTSLGMTVLTFFVPQDQ